MCGLGQSPYSTVLQEGDNSRLVYLQQSFVVTLTLCLMLSGEEEQPDLNDVVFALQEGKGRNSFGRAHASN